MRMRLIVLPALALAVGIYYWQTTPATSAVPAATWRAGSGTEIEQGHNYDDFPGDTPVRLSVRCPEPCYVYVFSQSLEDGTLLLFPSPSITSDLANPLPAGHTVLPGKRDGTEVAWTTRAGILALTTFVAVAAKEPVAELEALAPKLRRWSNQALPDGSMVVTLPAAGADVDGKPRQPMPSGLLLEAAELANQQANPNGPMTPAAGRVGVYLSAWKVRERRKPAEAAEPSGR